MLECCNDCVYKENLRLRSKIYKNTTIKYFYCVQYNIKNTNMATSHMNQYFLSSDNQIQMTTTNIAGFLCFVHFFSIFKSLLYTYYITYSTKIKMSQIYCSYPVT